MVAKDAECTNEVRLIGRLSVDPEERQLPSGDVLYVARLVVPRPQARAAPGRKKGPSVDVLDLAAWAARPQASLARLREGDVIEVKGAVRRRFFRSGGGAASRVEIEVSSAKRLRGRSSG